MLYTCDECLRGPLTKKRFRCQTCPEFDLCQRCFDQKKLHGHLFIEFDIVDDGGSDGGSDPETQQGDEQLTPTRQRKPASSNDSAAERMSALLLRIQLKLSLYQVSSSTSVQFLDLFDKTGECIRQSQSKKVSVMEQLLARTALVLIGIRLRRNLNSPLKLLSPEPELVYTVIVGFLIQVLACDSLVGEKLAGIRQRVEEEGAAVTFSFFYFDTMDVLRQQQTIGVRFAKVVVTALEELKEALGFDEPGLLVRPVEPPKKRSTDLDNEETKKQRLTPPLPLEPVADATSKDTKELGEMVAKMKRELGDAHGRVDVLAHILKDCVGAPLHRALDV
ncbi:hypothetical protein BASA81_013261 [Batrachochytrium salamandrivorans]|nr:hypothetical protein BASA81_013261 [Batrachochytrium salamandrivorans]